MNNDNLSETNPRVNHAPDAFEGILSMTDPLEEKFRSEKRKPIAAVIASADGAFLSGAAAPARGELAGQFTDAVALRSFLLAGRAILTVRSRASGVRFTLKFTRPDPKRDERPRAGEPPVWVSVLTGPDNGADYAYLGTVWPQAGALVYRLGTKSRIDADAPSQRAVRWFLGLLQRNPDLLFEQADVWHEGRCGRCGRQLTVPESIVSGFGPECINHV